MLQLAVYQGFEFLVARIVFDDPLAARGGDVFPVVEVQEVRLDLTHEVLGVHPAFSESFQDVLLRQLAPHEHGDLVEIFVAVLERARLRDGTYPTADTVLRPVERVRPLLRMLHPGAHFGVFRTSIPVPPDVLELVEVLPIGYADGAAIYADIEAVPVADDAEPPGQPLPEGGLRLVDRLLEVREDDAGPLLQVHDLRRQRIRIVGALPSGLDPLLDGSQDHPEGVPVPVLDGVYLDDSGDGEE